MRLSTPLALAATLLLANSCATIVSQSTYPVAFSSEPSGASFTITDVNGKAFFTGVTPATVPLKPGADYFQKQEYTIKFSKPGFDDKTMTITADINGWYFGNFLFGGVIGLVIVDPITGAMFRINDTQMLATLVTSGQGMAPPAPGSLQIVSIQDVPAALRDQLVPVLPR